MTNVPVVTEADVLTIKIDMADMAKELSGLVEHWQQRAERLRAQWEESEWYLGETRATVGRLEAQLNALREACSRLEDEVAAQLREQVRQRDEANWYLGELRVTDEALRQQNQQLTEQLAHAKDDVEGVHRTALEADVDAVQRQGERRGSVRMHRPDIVAEVRASEGLLLFHGCPPNISVTGLAFATGQSVDDASDFVEITLHVPEIGRPIEALGRLVWRETMEGTHQWGCELLDLLADSRKSLKDVLANAA